MTDKPEKVVCSPLFERWPTDAASRLLDDLHRRIGPANLPDGGDGAPRMTATEILARREAAYTSERWAKAIAALRLRNADSWQAIADRLGLYGIEPVPAPTESETALHRAVLATRKEQ